MLLVRGINSEECVGEASTGFVDGGNRERKLCDCGEPIACGDISAVAFDNHVSPRGNVLATAPGEFPRVVQTETTIHWIA
jgi:hypothetical protein